ncbi:MAG: T9SS type A sorting domain-containing protein [Bacteroidia bacterium]|nr:T9SS type A sorting domain-containing protein [Bacteroidia bacterium]
MKSLFIVSLFLFSFSVLFADNVKKTYRFENPEVIQAGRFSQILFNNTQQSGITGEPVLPYQMVSLLLPAGHEAINIRVEYAGETILPGTFILAPKQPSRPLSKPGENNFSINELCYASDRAYPEQGHGLLSTSFLSGYAIANCAITPLKYNPAKKTVSYYTEVHVTIETAPGKASRQALRFLRDEKAAIEKINPLVHNKEMTQQYPVKDTKNNDNYQNLILCPQQFAADFETLSALYLTQGLQTQIVSLEEIYSSVNGQDNQEKIRNFIIQEYTTHGITHVLLGGDVELFPYRGFYCSVQSSSLYEDYNIPSDLYYSALDGTWDDNGNGVWGEIGEDDLLPEVAVARFPFNTTTELQHMLHKTTEYQNNPVAGELNKPLLAGEDLYSDPQTWGADYLDLLIGYHDDNGYITEGIPENDPYLTLYDRDAVWSKTQLINEINQGHSFIHHSGHSNSNYTMRMYNSDVTDANFYAVNGVDHNYTLAYSHGCICGAFDDSDCIGEVMVTIENFLVAGAFNSRYGWFNEGQTEGPSAHLHREFIDAVYHDKKNRIGEAHLISRTETAPWVNAPGQWEEGALRWCFYDCNIFGDPALAIRTDELVEISATYPPAMVIGETSLTVNVLINQAATAGYTCAIVHEGIVYGTAITDATGTATLELQELFTEPCDPQLYISGYNAVATAFPLTIVPGDEAYIVVGETIVTDENGNGMPEYGEVLTLTTTMKNVGQESAENVMVTLTTEDPYLTVTDAEETFGTIAANAEVSIEEAFTVQIAENTPDQHLIQTQYNVTSGRENWQYNYPILCNSPVIRMAGMEVVDTQGNNNGRLDPGEEATLSFTLINSGHAESLEGTVTLENNGTVLTLLNASKTLQALDPESTAVLTFDVIVSPEALPGNIETLELQVASGAFNFTETLQIIIGLVMEDFETADFSAYEWSHSGNAQWIISETAPYEGLYCAASGTITDDQQSSLSVTLKVTTDDQISFYRKVSSEANYDYLEFYIDNILKGSWSGEEGWGEESFSVAAGTHTFSWKYYKDGYVSNGSDKGWIDYIIFPPVTIETGRIEGTNPAAFTFYPNPATDRIIIQVPGEGNTVSLQLFSLSGQLLKEIHTLTDAKVMMNVSDISQGTYILSILSSGVRHSSNIIKK